MDAVEKTIESYNKTAKEYTRKVSDLLPLEDVIYFKKLLPDNAKILDLGCGSGRDVKKFLELGLQATGIDLSVELLEIAISNIPSSNFQKMDVRNLSFTNESFDGVWASASLLHVPKSEIESCLIGIRKIIKNKGYFYCSFKTGKGEELKKDDRYDGVLKFWAFYQKDELELIFKRIGFQIVNCRKQRTISEDYSTNPFIVFFLRKLKGCSYEK